MAVLFGGTDSTGTAWAEEDSLHSTWQRQVLAGRDRAGRPCNNPLVRARRCSYGKAGLSEATFGYVDMGCQDEDTICTDVRYSSNWLENQLISYLYDNGW